MINEQDYKRLQAEIQEQNNKIEKQNSMLKKLTSDLAILLGNFQKHTHSGSDGSSKYFQNGIEIKPGTTFKTGNMAMEEFTTGAGVTTGGFTVGANSKGAGTSTVNKDGTQITIQHQKPTNGTTNQTFVEGRRSPMYISTKNSATFDIGSAVLSQSEYNWAVNELDGAYVVVYESDTEFVMYEITSNTETTLTIDSTFDFKGSGVKFEIFEPVYFGSAQTPWRRLYVIGDSTGGIRFGGGNTNGGYNSLLYTNGTNLYFRRNNGTVRTITTTG
jgi:hypothetical protein